MNRVDRYDIRVLKAGKTFGLAGGTQSHFQGYRPPRQSFLMSQKHASKCPATDLFYQPEAKEHFPRRRKTTRLARPSI
ncbi:MAG TPA: hypothetical protein VLM40_09740 [Gemmata sp.]|nr:hypothetical protein [Gemmata sp.]